MSAIALPHGFSLHNGVTNSHRPPARWSMVFAKRANKRLFIADQLCKFKDVGVEGDILNKTNHAQPNRLNNALSAGMTCHYRDVGYSL